MTLAFTVTQTAIDVTATYDPPGLGPVYIAHGKTAILACLALCRMLVEAGYDPVVGSISTTGAATITLSALYSGV